MSTYKIDLKDNTVNKGIVYSESHPYHLVDPSPWPIATALGAFFMLFGAGLWLHSYNIGFSLLVFGLVTTVLVAALWWRDVIREATFEGQHTAKVQRGLRWGMLIFIFSEVVFFSGFFWGFFHASMCPTWQIGGVWPPQAISVINPWEIPLLNTIILLTSGFTVTWAHHAIVSGRKSSAFKGLVATVLLAAIFTSFQLIEYQTAPFSLSDGIYGTTFYVATGFHGFHVIVGTLFLTVCTFRLARNHFSKQHHFGFEAAAWYWHFVDVVWLCLFISIYWWGSL